MRSLQKGFVGFIVLFIVVSILGVVGYILYINPEMLSDQAIMSKLNSNPQDNQSMEEESGGFEASFEITTNGTVRTFDNAMYFNQSEVAYIDSEKPNTVYVEENGVTWDDFFQTLPFELTKKCLVTGTGQEFCNNESQKLKFYINGVEDSNALDVLIQEEDKLEVVVE